MSEYARPRYEALVITPAFQILGQIEPVGTWLDFVNAREKHTLPVYNARLLSIGTSAGSTPEKPQVFVNRDDIGVIYLPDRNSHQSVYMLKNVQTAIAHIGPIICRGEWHMGMDATLATFIDDLPGHFFPITNADLHAKVPLPAPLPQKAELMLVNRLHIAIYHPA
jgi:hypothetical protein